MFSLSKIKDRLYHLEFSTWPDLTAHFLRYQEFYESPKFKGKAYQLIDYVKWYASTRKDKKFSYLTDWSGFNLPVNKILELYPLITDKNDHDELMYYIAKMITRDCKDPAYLIGTSPGTKSKNVLIHEIAHGLWEIDQEYHHEMNVMVARLPKSIKDNMTRVLLAKGYDKSVLDDEIHAYLSTGLIKGMRAPKNVRDKFRKTLDKYLK